MRGVAARYPAFDRPSGAVMDLEARINACRLQHQGAKPFERESEELLALTAYVAMQSRGYRGEIYTLDEFCMTPRDWLALAAFIGAATVKRPFGVSIQTPIPS